MLPLATLGAALAPDTDHLLRSLTAGSMLLIHLPPGDYAFEEHVTPEYIVCLSGVLRMADAAGNTVSASVGEMIEVSPGLSHHFAPDCAAVVLTLTQKPVG